MGATLSGNIYNITIGTRENDRIYVRRVGKDSVATIWSRAMKKAVQTGPSHIPVRWKGARKLLNYSLACNATLTRCIRIPGDSVKFVEQFIQVGGIRGQKV